MKNRDLMYNMLDFCILCLPVAFTYLKCMKNYCTKISDVQRVRRYRIGSGHCEIIIRFHFTFIIVVTTHILTRDGLEI